MDKYFASLFDDIRHERSLILIISIIDSDILKQTGFTDDEIEIIKNLALEKLHRQKNLKEYHALSLLND